MDRFQKLLQRVNVLIREGKMNDNAIAKSCGCAEMFVYRQRRFIRSLDACRIPHTVPVPVPVPVCVDVSNAVQMFLFPE